jgi:hypothetical protein
VRSALVLLVTIVSVLSAGARSLVAQTTVTQPRFQGASFLLARYVSTQTASLYGAYGGGPVMGLVGLVRNPRTDRTVVIVGGGTRVRVATHGRVTVLAGLAGGSGGTMIRLYALPALRIGNLRLTGTATTYVPLEAEGRWQASVDPLTLSLRAAPGLGVGLATVLKAEAGRGASAGAGPAVSVRVAGVTIRGEAIGMARPGRVEARTTIGVTF